VFDWAGVAAIEAEELAVVPGLDELFALTEVESLCASGRYDVVVVDCAPTAETVRLLSLPDILGWYMERLFPASRRISRVVGPLVSRITSLPMADDKVFAAGQRFYDQLDSVRRILADPSVTSARLVVNPERMVLAEARRTYTYLSLFGYQVDAVVVNRVLPSEAAGEWVDSWRLAQERHLCSIEEDFAPLPVLRAEHVGAEVVGLEALRQFGEALWSGVDPLDRLVEGRPLRLSREADHFLLSVELPFAERSELELTRNGDELFVAVGPHRRNLVLPDSLRRRRIGSASLQEGRLEVTFLEPDAAGT
jgi:arsenite/tail-anchored protein-transporting ATPase